MLTSAVHMIFMFSVFSEIWIYFSIDRLLNLCLNFPFSFSLFLPFLNLSLPLYLNLFPSYLLLQSLSLLSSLHFIPSPSNDLFLLKLLLISFFSFSFNSSLYFPSSLTNAYTMYSTVKHSLLK